MKRKTLLIGAVTVSAVVLFSLSTTFFFAEDLAEETSESALRDPTRVPASVPENYESQKACEKQNLLWERVIATQHKELPPHRKFGLLQIMAMAKQKVAKKGATLSDFAPEGWKKYLHGRGSIAKVKWVAKSAKYSGVFQGSECALLRLSLTYRAQGKRPVAPGIAIKFLRDSVPSGNISALVSLDGQGKDFNFFKNPLSNIVPIGDDMGQKMVHNIFAKATSYPEELLAEDLARTDSKGEVAKAIVSPRQLFFVPSQSLKFSSDEHEVREDFAKIPQGTVIYQVFAAADKYIDFDYRKANQDQISKLMEDSQLIADIITTSDFVSSEFGDSGVFFKHELRP